jgi:hypothetical protein
MGKRGCSAVQQHLGNFSKSFIDRDLERTPVMKPGGREKGTLEWVLVGTEKGLITLHIHVCSSLKKVFDNFSLSRGNLERGLPLFDSNK